MLRWLAASLIIVAVAIGAYVLGTFYPNSRVQQAPVAVTTPTPKETAVTVPTVAPTQTLPVPVAMITPEETVVPLPQVDPQQVMAYVLVQAGIDSANPAGQYFSSRAEALQGMFEIYTGNFSGDTSTSQDLAAFAQDWVTYMTAPSSSAHVQDWKQQVGSQIPAKADAIMASTAEGTPDDEFRRLVASQAAGGYKSEGEVYWDRLVYPTLVGQNLAKISMDAQKSRFDRLYTQYQAASFAGQATDLGIFLVQQGYSLSKD